MNQFSLYKLLILKFFTKPLQQPTVSWLEYIFNLAETREQKNINCCEKAGDIKKEQAYKNLLLNEINQIKEYLLKRLIGAIINAFQEIRIHLLIGMPKQSLTIINYILWKVSIFHKEKNKDKK